MYGVIESTFTEPPKILSTNTVNGTAKRAKVSLHSRLNVSGAEVVRRFNTLNALNGGGLLMRACEGPPKFDEDKNEETEHQTALQSILEHELNVENMPKFQSKDEIPTYKQGTLPLTWMTYCRADMSVSFPMGATWGVLYDWVQCQDYIESCDNLFPAIYPEDMDSKRPQDVDVVPTIRQTLDNYEIENKSKSKMSAARFVAPQFEAMSKKFVPCQQAWPEVRINRPGDDGCVGIVRNVSDGEAIEQQEWKGKGYDLKFNRNPVKPFSNSVQEASNWFRKVTTEEELNGIRKLVEKFGELNIFLYYKVFMRYQ